MSDITEILGDATLRVVGDEGDSLGEFATEILGDDDSGAWFHKLNPGYWLKSKRERNLIDAEKNYGEQSKHEAKWLKSREKQLKEGEKAAAAKQAALAAHAKSDEAENRLKEIETELSGAFVGEDDPAAKDALANKIAAAAEGQVAAQKNKRRSGAILAKIEAGEKLTPEDVAKLKSCLRVCRALRKYHEDLHSQTKAVTTSGYREPDRVEKNAPSASFLGVATNRIPKDRWIEMIAIAATSPNRLPAYTKQYRIVLSPANRGHLANMAKMTQKQIAKKTGVSGVGLDVWGGIKKAALLPIAATTYGTYKTLALMKKAGGAIASPFRSKSAPSSDQSRAARIAAARARKIAALKRQQAASAQTAAAQQEAAAQADAAAAEADAAQAEADAQDAAAQAQEAEYAPADDGDGAPPDDGSTSGGAFVGAFVGSFVGAEAFKGDWTSAVVGENDKKLVAAAASDTKTGKKIRAGAAVAHAARKGDGRAKMAVKKMADKAKKGDVQAKRDLTAVKAGDSALKAKAKAKQRFAFQKANEAGAAHKVAITKKLEVATGDKLARMSRKHQLVKVAKVEHRAATGDRHAKAVIAETVAKAQGGDKKAKTAVAALKLARQTRLASSTPRERKNLAQAGKVIRKARAGNRDAIKKVRVVQAAAKSGQPNAKRAVARLQTAAALEHAVSTGKIVLPPMQLSASAKTSATKKTYAHYARRASSKSGTREEAIAAARAAHKLGMKDKAADLTLAARSKPSATVSLKNAATMAAASKAGNPEAKKVVAAALSEAQKGNPAGIKSAGNLAAVHALNEMKSGKPMPAGVADGVNVVRRAQAGDPEAKRTVERASAAAEAGNSAGVTAAVSLSAGAALLAATASRPDARAKLVEKANQAQGIAVLPADRQEASAELAQIYAKVQRGEANRGEAERGRQLALGMGNARMAAEISALMPPFDAGDPRSSMPDLPLPPINGAGDLIKESLKALFFATADPLANYREGVKSRSEG